VSLSQTISDLSLILLIIDKYSSVVIDIYRPNTGRVVLIDINPFGESTDSLLFDWDELNGLRDDNYTNEVRVTVSQNIEVLFRT
jgi:hypothetical protein